MRKLINLFVLPLFAGLIVSTALYYFIPQQHKENIDMLGDQTNVIFGFLGFLFGFMPVFIRNMAAITLQSLRPVAVVELEQVSQVADQVPFNPLPLYVGQMFTSAGANCKLRVKAINVPAILEYYNPGIADLM